MPLPAGEASGRRLLPGHLQSNAGPSDVLGVRVPRIGPRGRGCCCRCPATATTASCGGRRSRRRSTAVGGQCCQRGGHLFAALCSRIVLRRPDAGRRFVRQFGRRCRKCCCCTLVCSAVTHHLPANPPTLGALDSPLVQRRYLLVSQSVEISVNHVVAVLKLRRFKSQPNPFSKAQNYYLK